MQKIAACFTLFAMAALLTACGGKETKADTMDGSEDSAEQTQDEESQPEEMMDDMTSDDAPAAVSAAGSNIHAHVTYSCTKSGEDNAVYTYYQYKEDSTLCSKEAESDQNCLCEIKANTGDGESVIFSTTKAGLRKDCESHYLKAVKNGGSILDVDVPNYAKEGWSCSQEITKLDYAYTGFKSVFE